MFGHSHLRDAWSRRIDHSDALERLAPLDVGTDATSASIVLFQTEQAAAHRVLFTLDAHELVSTQVSTVGWRVEQLEMRQGVS